MFSQSDVIGFLTCKELVKTLLVRSIGKQNKRSSRLSILHYFFVYIYYLYCTAGILDNQTATSAHNPLNVEEKDMNMTVLLPQQEVTRLLVVALESSQSVLFCFLW